MNSGVDERPNRLPMTGWTRRLRPGNALTLPLTGAGVAKPSTVRQ